jgi:2'-5' RNA ligase
MQAVVSEARVPPRITWVKDEAAHITLRFIGETPEARLTDFQSALERVHVAPFAVTWGTLGVFGGLRNPRVLLIAPTDGAELLVQVAAQVASALDPLIGTSEARLFKPHLTVARIREAGRGVDWAGALQSVVLTPSVTQVQCVTLYQSRLSPKGPTYTALSSHG